MYLYPSPRRSVGRTGLSYGAAPYDAAFTLALGAGVGHNGGQIIPFFSHPAPPPPTGRALRPSGGAASITGSDTVWGGCYGPRADRGQTESDAHRTIRTALCKYVIGDGRSRSRACTGNGPTRAGLPAGGPARGDAGRPAGGRRVGAALAAGALQHAEVRPADAGHQGAPPPPRAARGPG